MGSYAHFGLSDDDFTPMPQPRRHPARAFLHLWEIVPAAASAVITTCYAVQHESAVNDGELADLGVSTKPCLANYIWVLNPGPGMMLGACLVFGCSMSSFSYRRQDLDKFQSVFFIVAVCAACTSGIISGSNPNVILLGYVPWALCIAILSSAASHWVMRQCGIKTAVAKHEPEDKEAW